MTTDFDDQMFDFTIEHEHPTGELFLAALAAFPNNARDVRSYFQAWVWLEWHDANIPQREPTEADEAETAAWVEQSLMRFYEKVFALEGRLSPPGRC